MNINFTYDPGTTLQQMTIFEMAGKIWSRYLQDNVTVNLQVGVTQSSNLPKKVIGAAIPGMQANVNYQTYHSNTIQDAKSLADNQSVSNLDSGSNYGYFDVTDQNGAQYGFWAGADTLNMTRANAKALGLLAPTDSNLDGYILLSDLNGQGVSWDLTTDTADVDKLDLLSTAVHEIGHILGFVSGVDQADVLPQTVNNINFYDSSEYQRFAEAVKRSTPLDRFRDVNTSANAFDDPSLTQGSKYGEQFFSLDGLTHHAAFAVGDRVQGHQASHWKEQASNIGIMDPALRRGERPKFSGNDLRAMDVIGWDMVGGLESTVAATNVALNYQQLYSEARSSLASRLGRTTTWLNSNQTTAASQLSQVRVADIVAMAQSSQIYNLNWFNNYGGVGAWLSWAQQQGVQSFWLNWWNQGGATVWWQTMNQVFTQTGLYETLLDEADGQIQDQLHDYLSDELSQIDGLTGLQAQQPLVASSRAGETAPSNRQPAELFDSSVVSQDPLLGYGQSVGSGISGEPAYGEMALFQLGSGIGYGEDVLATGLIGLGQDPLQGSAQLGQLFATAARLGG
jgi:hypothetical protein